MSASTHGYSVRRFTPERGAWSKLMARDSVVRRLDWVLLLTALALSAIGGALVYSATRNRTELNQGDPYYFLVRHALNTGIGLLLAIGTIWLGHRTLRGAVPVLYGLSVILVLAVLTPLGSTINGAHAWIVVGGGFSLQPGEFAKITIILGMAMLLAARVDAGDRLNPDHRTVVQALGLAGLPIAIVLLMPDLGSVMVMAMIVLAVLLSSGASNRWIAGLILTAVVGALLVWQLHVLDQYQIDRFAAFANPALDPAGVGYNTNQARIAIGSGGLTGKGLFHGTQTTGQFVPEQQTDFVFTVAGEELGFLGAGLIILLLGVVLWRACRIARDTTELYGTVVAAGIIAWFAFQAFENIGMTLGIMPVAGLPLPFVSYGGSSMFAVWIAIGLLQSIRVQRPVSA
ncbi:MULTISPECIES: rod shape-determining protein RodA [Streptomyces violaceusniger group]|uniref:peptidoglycan glycosyltransferase n=3 Tax=Streptomyces violaceusniger group TaxID=2839105 RepID=A0A0A0NP17_STRRN|nr:MULTISPECIES: rod shape-determining protein RodA [Streptomyces violaceusniger group]AGP57868.1 rod shape-determining protein RodA [Streptomyces rapamycinicus NRRL 5491]MBB4785535.1 rod shape determining protein RodA [Streptomyces rapamycinicus]MBP2065172.1 rod shape determining protein RodA [Streptomyces iranensis]RLV78999.1 rod shape-determining protein RodA [Streptomyces rapamycinicus NRRL 5491]UTO65709.1 rod shape-determining protein RodA [Streptomyces rapamycinicus]